MTRFIQFKGPQIGAQPEDELTCARLLRRSWCHREWVLSGCLRGLRKGWIGGF